MIVQDQARMIAKKSKQKRDNSSTDTSFSVRLSKDSEDLSIQRSAQGTIRLSFSHKKKFLPTRTTTYNKCS